MPLAVDSVPALGVRLRCRLSPLQVMRVTTVTRKGKIAPCTAERPRLPRKFTGCPGLSAPESYMIVGWNRRPEQYQRYHQNQQFHLVPPQAQGPRNH